MVTYLLLRDRAIKMTCKFLKQFARQAYRLRLSPKIRGSLCFRSFDILTETLEKFLHSAQKGPQY